MQVRRDKRDRLASGQGPHPVSVARTHSLAEVREQWGHLEQGEETQDAVGVAGRVVFIRNTGKLAFATLQEGIGTRLQVMLNLAGWVRRPSPTGRRRSTSATTSSWRSGHQLQSAVSCR